MLGAWSTPVLRHTDCIVTSRRERHPVSIAVLHLDCHLRLMILSIICILLLRKGILEIVVHRKRTRRYLVCRRLLVACYKMELLRVRPRTVCIRCQYEIPTRRPDIEGVRLIRRIRRTARRIVYRIAVGVADRRRADCHCVVLRERNLMTNRLRPCRRKHRRNDDDLYVRRVLITPIIYETLLARIYRHRVRDLRRIDDVERGLTRSRYAARQGDFHCRLADCIVGCV